MHEGHRQRLKERFLQEGLNGFAPHEVLELLLFFAIPQRDVNPLAYELLAHFGSLSAVFDASADQLVQVEGIGPAAATLLALMVPLARRVEAARMGDRPRLASRKDVQDYCINLLSNLPHEHFYLLALNAQMQLLGKALIAKGSLSEVAAYPRLAVEAAIRFNAHSAILCHNHPGGSADPSAADLNATRRLAEALAGIDVAVLDHIIVASSRAESMVQMGYLSLALPEDLATAADSTCSLPPKK